MQKKYILLLLFIYTNITIFCQEKKNIIFINTKDKQPVSDVKVFHENNLLAISDEYGYCYIDTNINDIDCYFLNLIDTNLNIKSTENIYFLDLGFSLLNAISIEDKYNAKKHLIFLLNQNVYETLDTNIFYNFFIKQVVPDFNQFEIFEGIFTSYFNKEQEKTIYNYYCQIINCFSTIYPEVYKEIKWINPINQLIRDCDITKKENSKFIKRKDVIVEKIDNNSDTLIFKIVIKNNKITEQKFYIQFYKETIIYCENFKVFNENSMKRLTFFIDLHTSYYQIQYKFINNVVVIDKASLYLKYSTKNYKNLSRSCKILSVIHSDTISDIHYKVMGHNSDIEFIKLKYPDLIIPSSPEAFYKFDF
ncbi:MAG: hypothetical protein LBV69_00540 [Bacteroidales bacterium]|jgi:hypothetical protein|nr:hypothetical protein [Bacteroidales bacterium]